MMQLVDFLLHIDDYLQFFILNYGYWIYVILFLIIFVETGLVVMPFLPGDSLLFATGMLAAQPNNNMSLMVIMLSLSIAAILGDSLNYYLGTKIGYKITRFKIFGYQPVKQEYVDKTQSFYAKYGSKTIVIARFVPIVRTLAPFIAGIGRMDYRTFISYNIIGGILWINGLLLAGYFLGNIPIIADNFSKVVYIIIILSILPIIYSIIKEKMLKK